MDFSFLETVLLATCLFLSVAALLVIFRNQRTYLSLTDLDMLRQLIRNEIAVPENFKRPGDKDLA